MVRRQFSYPCESGLIELKFHVGGDNLPDDIDHTIDHAVIPTNVLIVGLPCQLRTFKPKDARGPAHEPGLKVSEPFDSTFAGVHISGFLDVSLGFTPHSADQVRAEALRPITAVLSGDLNRSLSDAVVNKAHDDARARMRSQGLGSLEDFFSKLVGDDNGHLTFGLNLDDIGFVDTRFMRPGSTSPDLGFGRHRPHTGMSQQSPGGPFARS